VTAVTVHASGDYLVTASLDRTWAFYDLAAQLCLAQARPSARAAAADCGCCVFMCNGQCRCIDEVSGIPTCCKNLASWWSALLHAQALLTRAAEQERQRLRSRR